MKPIVKVTWMDACASHGWKNDVTQPTPNVTVGFEVHNCEHFIEVAGTYAEDTGYWNNSMSIPQECVLEYEVMEEEDDEEDFQVEICFENE